MNTKNLAIIFSVQEYFNRSEFPKIEYAGSNAEQTRVALLSAGFKNTDIICLINEQASLAMLRGSLASIQASNFMYEQIYVFYIGHGLLYEGLSYLTSVDSFLNNVQTYLPLSDFFETINALPTGQKHIFFDAMHAQNSLLFDPLSVFKSSKLARCTIFVSCSKNEISLRSKTLKSGIWYNNVLKSIRGEVAQVLSGNFQDIISNKNLQGYLQNQTLKDAEQLFSSRKKQTPEHYSSQGECDVFQVAKTNKAHSNLNLIKQVTFLAREEKMVIDLPGFRKNFHKVPDQINDFHNIFIRNNAQQLVEDEVTLRLRKIKENLKYKLADKPNTIIEPGRADISSKHFDYQISISQSQEKPDQALLTKTLSNLNPDQNVEMEMLDEIFDNTFTTLEVSLSEKVSVAEIIKRIEDGNDQDLRVEYDYDHDPVSTDEHAIDQCKIIVESDSVELALTAHTLSMHWPLGELPLKMLHQFGQVYERVLSRRS